MEQAQAEAGSLLLLLKLKVSSLASGSRPIEEASSNQDGLIESLPIYPAGIERWIDSAVQAERLHSIPRAQLLAKGNRLPGSAGS